MNVQASHGDRTVSAADIVIPATPHYVQPERSSASRNLCRIDTLPKADVDAFFAEMRELMAACGPEVSKNDVASVLICAGIDFGFDTRKRIIGALCQLSFDYRHAAIILRRGTGNNPRLHRWRCDGEGRYSLHPELAATSAVGIEAPALKL